MPESFAQAPNGLVYAASGLTPVLRWDGFTPLMETAGIVPPEGTPSIAGSGSGTIVGKLYALVRFVDRFGNFSNMSELSTGVLVNDGSGIIINATNNTPIYITYEANTVGIDPPPDGTISDGDTLYITDCQGNIAANGKWIAASNVNGIYLTDGEGDRTFGGGEYSGGGVYSKGVETITYSNLPVPTDPKVVKRQILRNKPGETGTFYVDIETEDLTATELTSTKTDDELTDDLAVSLQDTAGRDLELTRYSPPPNHRPVIFHHSDRMFGVGTLDYTEGAVVLTFGSTAVTGINTEWWTEMGGRLLNVVGAPKSYLIDSVDQIAQTLVLAEAWQEPSNPYGAYSISPPTAEERLVDFSMAGLPEAWPTDYNLSLPDDQLAGRVTGGFSMSSWAYVLCDNRIYRITYQNSPLPPSAGGDGGIFKSADRGCVNNRCWVIVEGSAYILDRSGVYVYDGSDFEPLSTPIQPIFEVQADSPYQINWDASRYFHAAYDQNEKVIRFFVALHGGYTPRHAICVDFRQKLWSVEEYPRPISSSAAGFIGKQPQLFLGTNRGMVLAGNAGVLDGPQPTDCTVSGLVTTSGATWIADSTATYNSSRIVGWPVVITKGTGRGQSRNIVSVSGTRLNVDQPWLKKPDTTSVYQIGGIQWVWRSGWFRWIAPAQGGNVKRRLEVMFQPTVSESSLYARLYRDFHSSSELSGVTRETDYNAGIGATLGAPEMDIDTTKPEGYVQQQMDGQREWYTDGRRLVAVEIGGVANAERQRINQVAIDGAQHQ